MSWDMVSTISWNRTLGLKGSSEEARRASGGFKWSAQLLGEPVKLRLTDESEHG